MAYGVLSFVGWVRQYFWGETVLLSVAEVFIPVDMPLNYGAILMFLVDRADILILFLVY